MQSTSQLKEETSAISEPKRKPNVKEEQAVKKESDSIAMVKKTETGGCIVFGTVFEVGDSYEIVSPIG